MFLGKEVIIFDDKNFIANPIFVDQNTTLKITWYTFLKNQELAKHIHDDLDEIYTVFDGLVKVVVGDQIFEAGKGDSVLVKKGNFHSVIGIDEKSIVFSVKAKS